MAIRDLIEALDLVGQVYRNKDGSKPADSVAKIIQQLTGAENMCLAEWLQNKQSKPKPQTKKTVKPKPDGVKIADAISNLENADSQSALRMAIDNLKLSPGEWQAISKKLTGKAGRSGKAARELTEMHFSDQLLLKDRVESVKRQFNPATPRPAA